MAFFDDDPPTQQQRRPGPPPPPPVPPRGAPDPQQILARRLVVLGTALVLVLFVAVVMKGCVDGQRKDALQSYNQKVNELGTESAANVTKALQTLSSPDNTQPQEQRSEIDRLAAATQDLTDRARDTSTPGGLAPATEYMATAVGLRADALARIADRISNARGTSKTQAEEATAQIAGQMQVLLAADVLWQTRVTPFIRDRYKELEVPDDAIKASVALDNLSWLDTATVSSRIDGQASAAVDDNTPAAPGTHGHGIGTVTANGKELATGGAVTTVPAGAGLSFVVTIANGGENDETDVPVTVSAVDKATGKKLFDQTKKVGSSKKGEQTPITIPITSSVTKSFTVTVEVAPVKGEDKTDNNKETYLVLYPSGQ